MSYNEVKRFKTELVKTNELIPDKNNPNEMNDLQVQALDYSFTKWGDVRPIVIDSNTNTIVDGHHRWEVLKERDEEYVEVIKYPFKDQNEIILFRQTMNKLHGSHNKVKDAEEIYALMQANQTEILSNLLAQDKEQLQALVTYYHPDKSLFSDQRLKDMGAATGAGSLAANWGIPPFSVLDRRTSTWQKRKQEWINFGITSELGRNEDTQIFAKDINKFQKPKDEASAKQVSIFDPVLTELMCRWFTIPDIYQGAKVLDPFAGGSVRGIVNSFLGNRYIGIDLSSKQIDENEAQYEAVKHRMPDNPACQPPDWRVGDSNHIDEILHTEYDFILTSPPFFNLEKYSDNEQDLSNMTYQNFEDSYQNILTKSVEMLKPNRFAAINMSNVRDKRTGYLIDLVGLTHNIMASNGMQLYNEFVIVHPIFTLQFRAGRSFMNRRTVGKQHEFMLVYYKGSPSEIEKIQPKHIEIPNDIQEEDQAKEVEELLYT